MGRPWGRGGAAPAGAVPGGGPGGGGGGGGQWVRADVRLAPGNSGGPLADAHGWVIGINSMIAGGLALAVPSEAVERFLHAPEERATIGVVARPVGVVLRRRPVLGLLIVEIAAGSAADDAGLLIGDVLIGVGGRLLSSPDDLPAAIHDAGAGGTVALELVRGGARITREVIPRAAPGAKAA